MCSLSLTPSSSFSESLHPSGFPSTHLFFYPDNFPFTHLSLPSIYFPSTTQPALPAIDGNLDLLFEKRSLPQAFLRRRGSSWEELSLQAVSLSSSAPGHPWVFPCPSLGTRSPNKGNLYPPNTTVPMRWAFWRGGATQEIYGTSSFCASVSLSVKWGSQSYLAH